MANLHLPFTQNSFARRITNKISFFTNKGIYQSGNYSALRGT